MNNQDQLIEIFQKTGALLEGHFILTSGRHSPTYFQCAKVLQYPEYLQKFSNEIVNYFQDINVDIVITPAVGGIVLGTEIGRQLNKQTIFAEREQGIMTLRRGFEINPETNVLVIEDVITTGGSVSEVIELVNNSGANVVGVGVLVDRSGGKVKLHEKQFCVTELEAVSYGDDQIPEDLANIPVLKPGSRSKMKKTITLIMIGSIIMTSCEKQPDVAVVSTRYGDMVLEFYPEVAEKHVDSFLTHARNGYFNGTTFHRVIPGFVIQGGDPNSKSDDRSTHGMGGHAANFYGIGQEDDSNSWMLPAEFNSRPHLTGTLSMARSQSPNSAGSQFFICAGPTPQLDNQYTVFGQVVEGLDVIQKIVNSPRDRRDNPKDKVEMNVSVMPRDEALDD